ncbi:hypothetical protein C8R45DRAFT_267954 [Mycena sanguinolenta]|nr:hypothetical protein C8R45DRAFT_267954 [Mycena sanguinolenta]
MHPSPTRRATANYSNSLPSRKKSVAGEDGDAFILFRRNYCQLSSSPSKTISEQWKGLSPEERAKWERLAREKKREHEALRPARSGPRKNSAVPSATARRKHPGPPAQIEFVAVSPFLAATSSLPTNASASTSTSDSNTASGSGSDLAPAGKTGKRNKWVLIPPEELRAADAPLRSVVPRWVAIWAVLVFGFV